MPKIRPLSDSLLDMLKHARVFTARVENLDNMKKRQEYTRRITDISVGLQSLLNEFASDENEVGSYSNEELNTASNVINKEAKKNMPKMKPVEILRAMHNTTNQIDAMKIGLAQGITQEQIKILIKKAPPNTPLGKYMSAKIAKQAQAIPIKPPAAIQPEEYEEQNTIDSDDEPNDELMKLLEG